MCLPRFHRTQLHPPRIRWETLIRHELIVRPGNWIKNNSDINKHVFLTLCVTHFKQIYSINNIKMTRTYVECCWMRQNNNFELQNIERSKIDTLSRYMLARPRGTYIRTNLLYRKPRMFLDSTLGNLLCFSTQQTWILNLTSAHFSTKISILTKSCITQDKHMTT